MKTVFHNKVIVIIGVVFLLVVLGTVIVTGQFGNALGMRFNSITPPINTDPVSGREKKQIKRVTLQNDDDTKCIQVTPDGIIRVFETCEGEATNAARSQENKIVQELFKRIEETTFTSQYRRRPNGKSIIVTVETEQGTEVLYLPVSSGGNGSGLDNQIQQIVETIDKITDIVTLPTPTPQITDTPTPTLPPGVTSTPTPTTTVTGPTPTDTPVPTGTIAPQPFTCGFTETNGPKPYNISNYVCTTEPTPGL